MTVSELERYFGDRKFFPNPDQEVRFSLTPYGTPKEQEQTVELCGSTVPEVNPAVVVLRPVVKRKFIFSLKFEANPEIEAETLEEAEKIAADMMRDCAVTKVDHDGEHFVQNDYEAQEPYFLEEVKE